MEPRVPDVTWMDELDPREKAQVIHAIDYARNHSAAGAPSHGQFVLIAKLARMLGERHPPMADNSLLTPAAKAGTDLSRPPDASKRPGGFA